MSSEDDGRTAAQRAGGGDAAVTPAQARGAARLVGGLISFIAIVAIGLNTAGNVSDAIDFGASAIQVVEVYTEGLFWMMFTLGLTVAGYVVTRTGE